MPAVKGADLEELRDLAEDAVRRGGEVVAAHFGRPLDFLERKGPGDYVTAADRASDEVIRDSLRQATPDIDVVSEEGGGEPGGAYWCVDPLDGTRNFSLGLPLVAVSVALIIERRPMVGAVGAPLLGLSFSAARGLGAWSGHKRLAVSVRPPAQAVVATGFPLRDRSLLRATSPRWRLCCGERKTSVVVGLPHWTLPGWPRASSTATSSST